MSNLGGGQVTCVGYKHKGLCRCKEGLDEPAASWVGNKSSAEWGKVKQKEIHNFISFI